MIKLKSLASCNVIELTYDHNKEKGRCKTKGHVQQQFNKLYVIPYVKTLNCQYFEDIFIIVLLNNNLVVLKKQQYYISFGHKICEECLERLQLECPIHVTCLMYEATQNINYLTRTRWIFYMTYQEAFRYIVFENLMTFVE